MSNGRLTRLFPFLTVLSVVGLLLPMGCGNITPMDPQESFQQNQINIVSLDLPEGVSLQSELSATEIIGSKGGKVKIPGFLELDIPKDALDEEISISISIPNTDEFIWELEPDGTVFNEEIELKVSLQHVEVDESESLDVFWDDNGSWTSLGAEYERGENSFEVELQHFSRYALATE